MKILLNDLENEPRSGPENSAPQQTEPSIARVVIVNSIPYAGDEEPSIVVMHQETTRNLPA